MSLPPPPDLSDGVVRLRAWSVGDAPAVTEACRDPEIQRWTRVPSPYGPADAEAFLGAAPSEWRAGTSAPLAIVDAETASLLGSTGLNSVDPGNRRGEVGYWLAPAGRGRGVMGRALRLLVRWCFDEAGLVRIEAKTDVANISSQRVAERAGFTREGVLRSYDERHGERRDVVLFSLLHDDPPVIG